MTILEGQSFAGFEVVAKLGQGGMGAVYKARQPLLDRFVALKVMSPQLSGDPVYIARFIREAASAAKLNHPNMVQVYTAGEQGGVYYIVMEFVEGESLSQRLKRTGSLDLAEAIAITLHVATALQCAWNEARLIHRDIKPDNIFLSKKGEVKVGDLGLAKSVSGGATEMTQSGMMMGSPHYISPEQARSSKETDFRADIYSLGCTLYQLLTGRTPYQADESLAVILKHVTEPVPDILAVMPNCPQVLAALASKMMAKDPSQRHASYEELMAELWQASDIINQQQSAATAVLTSTPAPAAAAIKPTVAKAATVAPTVVGGGKLVISNWRLVIGGVVAVATLLLFGLFLWSPWKSSMDEQGRREDAKTGSESRLQAESVSGQPAKAGTPNTASPQHSPTPSLQHSAVLKLLGNVFTNAVGAEMVYIPPGEFMLGSTKEEQAWAVADGMKEEYVKREGKSPRKVVIKQGLWMGRTELTVGQWKRFVKETGYVTDAEKKGESHVQEGNGKPWAPKRGISWRNPDFGFETRDNHPVSHISWNDAVAFCEWLTERERKVGRLASDLVVRLPTEAEWEYACRAGSQMKFWWGDGLNDSQGRLNWSGEGDGFGLVAPVDGFGERGRNGFGLADMLGNLNEWCLDAYDVAQAHGDVWTGNPGERAFRGGAFHNHPADCRSATRGSRRPSFSNSTLGFRVCYGGDVLRGMTTKTSTSPAAASKESTILAPPETRVPVLTTAPKVGEVYTLPLGSNVTMELMGIPPGEFMLGSTKEEQEQSRQASIAAVHRFFQWEGAAQRKAALRQGFWMGRTEVTVGQWRQFAAATGYRSAAEKAAPAGPTWRKPPAGVESTDHHPICFVSWDDARTFCDWMTTRAAGSLPAGWGCRLPAEAEWEYACRAGTQTRYWWSDKKEDGIGRLNDPRPNDKSAQAMPVDHFGMRGRNAFGLADMLGNVWEWCLDAFDENGAHAELWQGNPAMRVLRGSSFRGGTQSARCAARYKYRPSDTLADFGFRVVVGAPR